MKIALVSPLFESVPPRLYGGTERVVSYLTEELVRQGHAVTLFASGDSITRARLHACSERGLRLGGCRDTWAAHVLQMEEVIESAPQFDIIHFHTDHLHQPFVRHLRIPALTTLHGRLDLPELAPLYRRFNDAPLVSISDAQRRPLPFANWVGTVHHGMPPELLAASSKPGSYLAFLGRISPEKGPDRAIRIARRAGIPIKIAAKVDRQDQAFFEREVAPLLGAPGVEFIGEISDRDKNAFLAGALALLFPIDWPEPFGIVMIESIACGTPVIAFPCGSVREIVKPGVSGVIARGEDEAVAAARRVESLDRAACRRAFEQRFTAERMAHDYLNLYQGVLEVHALSQRMAAARSTRRALAEVSAPTAASGIILPRAN